MTDTERLLADYRQYVEVENEKSGEWFWLDQIEDRIGRERYLQIMEGQKPVDVATLQDVADRALHKIALRYGSTTKRDFFVIEIVLKELIGSETPVLSEASGQSAQERERPKDRR